MTEASRRRVRVTVGADVGPETLSVVPGVSGVSVRGNGDPTVTILECEVMGELDGVVKALAHHRVVDLISEPLTLEQLFLESYQLEAS